MDLRESRSCYHLVRTVTATGKLTVANGGARFMILHLQVLLMIFNAIVTDYHRMGSLAGGGGSLIPVGCCCVVRGGEEVQSTEAVL